MRQEAKMKEKEFKLKEKAKQIARVKQQLNQVDSMEKLVSTSPEKFFSLSGSAQSKLNGSTSNQNKSALRASSEYRKRSSIDNSAISAPGSVSSVRSTRSTPSSSSVSKQRKLHTNVRNSHSKLDISRNNSKGTVGAPNSTALTVHRPISKSKGVSAIPFQNQRNFLNRKRSAQSTETRAASSGTASTNSGNINKKPLASRIAPNSDTLPSDSRPKKTTALPADGTGVPKPRVIKKSDTAVEAYMKSRATALAAAAAATTESSIDENNAPSSHDSKSTDNKPINTKPIIIHKTNETAVKLESKKRTEPPTYMKPKIVLKPAESTEPSLLVDEKQMMTQIQTKILAKEKKGIPVKQNIDDIKFDVMSAKYKSLHEAGIMTSKDQKRLDFLLNKYSKKDGNDADKPNDEVKPNTNVGTAGTSTKSEVKVASNKTNNQSSKIGSVKQSPATIDSKVDIISKPGASNKASRLYKQIEDSKAASMKAKVKTEQSNKQSSSKQPANDDNDDDYEHDFESLEGDEDAGTSKTKPEVKFVGMEKPLKSAKISNKAELVSIELTTISSSVQFPSRNDLVNESELPLLPENTRFDDFFTSQSTMSGDFGDLDSVVTGLSRIGDDLHISTGTGADSRLDEHEEEDDYDNEEFHAHAESNKSSMTTIPVLSTRQAPRNLADSTIASESSLESSRPQPQQSEILSTDEEKLSSKGEGFEKAAYEDDFLDSDDELMVVNADDAKMGKSDYSINNKSGKAAAVSVKTSDKSNKSLVAEKLSEQEKSGSSPTTSARPAEDALPLVSSKLSASSSPVIERPTSKSSSFLPEIKTPYSADKSKTSSRIPISNTPSVKPLFALGGADSARSQGKSSGRMDSGLPSIVKSARSGNGSDRMNSAVINQAETSTKRAAPQHESEYDGYDLEFDE